MSDTERIDQLEDAAVAQRRAWLREAATAEEWHEPAAAAKLLSAEDIHTPAEAARFVQMYTADNRYLSRAPERISEAEQRRRHGEEVLRGLGVEPTDAA